MNDKPFFLAKEAVEAAFVTIETDLTERLGFPFALSNRSKKSLRYVLSSALAANILQARKERENE
jgi:hypothetical protein